MCSCGHLSIPCLVALGERIGTFSIFSWPKEGEEENDVVFFPLLKVISNNFYLVGDLGNILLTPVMEKKVATTVTYSSAVGGKGGIDRERAACHSPNIWLTQHRFFLILLSCSLEIGERSSSNNEIFPFSTTFDQETDQKKKISNLKN